MPLLTIESNTELDAFFLKTLCAEVARMLIKTESCALIHHETGISSNRIYIEFSAPERHHWGWNGATF